MRHPVRSGPLEIPNLCLLEIPSLFILDNNVVLGRPILAAAPLAPAITHPTDSKVSTSRARSESRNVSEKDAMGRASAFLSGL